MHKLFLPLAFAAFAIPHVSAQQSLSDDSAAYPAPTVESTGPLSLPAALALAMRANPEIAVAAREVDALDGNVLQAGVIPNPSISASVDDTRQATRTTTVQINVPIELGGKRSARMTAAERGRDAAMIDLAGKRSEIRAVVVAAFYELMTAQEQLQLATASSELAQRATNVAAKRVLAGKVSPVEETRARVAEANVRSKLALAASDVQSARRRLAATWGSVTPRFEQAVDTEQSLPAVPAFDQLAQQLQQSPGLARARIEVDRRRALAGVERSRQMPDLTLSFGAKRDEQLGRNQAIVGVSIPLPIFDRNQGNLLEALRRTDKARDELFATEVRLNSELAQAYDRLGAARQEVTLLKQEILPGAQSAYDATTKGFEFGKFSFLEVLDAQRTFFQARFQYLRALAETHRAATDIERLLGAPFPPIK
ncbi:MAG: cobalt-zinc-cadmium resistance protein [Burkholderiales bacterium RIFCSPLOWO2_02_FULL_57_36]|nr:MAG: cobalt-zinc-cadmium resistance protein [Burkholderiales bacterium RIFCSPLOWO2_02_FULL_57_36]